MTLKTILIAALALTATHASAALFVSGDVNIANNIAASPANQAFFTNILTGPNVSVQNNAIFSLDNQAQQLVDFYNDAGYTATFVAAGVTLDASDLSGKDLFIAVAPDDAFTAGETTLLAGFLASGHSVLLLGENWNFTSVDGYINVLLSDLGSGLRIVPGLLDAGYHNAQLQGPSPYLTGTTGFGDAGVSQVTGGLGLFGTEEGNVTFLAVEGAATPTPALPEPASWALFVTGFGLVGAMLRRRAIVVA